MRAIRVDKRLLHAGGRGGVVIDLERIEAFAAGERFQRRGVVDELRERHEREHARTPMPTASVPRIRPRIAAQWPVMSPTLGVGTVTASRAIGSRIVGVAFVIASMNALRPAVTNATSFESTGWCLPS